jgi:hypothetical protein
MIAVLMEKLLEVPGSSVEGPFGAGGAMALPKFAKVALFFQEVSDVGRAIAKVGRGRRSGGGGPTRPLNCVIKE